MYCSKCVQKYIKDTPIVLPCGTIGEDFGVSVTLEYTNNYYNSMVVDILSTDSDEEILVT